jgi:hypothetical protein
MKPGQAIKFENDIKLKDLIMALSDLAKEGHENDYLELSKDAEGNGFKPIFSIECCAKGCLTFFPVD